MKILKMPYIVYMNKSHGMTIQDAYKFAVLNGLKEGVDYVELISETVYRSHKEYLIINDTTPIYFVTQRQTVIA